MLRLQRKKCCECCPYLWLKSGHNIKIILCNKATEETFWCPQTFIVRFLMISTSATTGFYSRTERKGQQVCCRRNRERACVGVCALRENKVGVHWNWTLGIASVWTTFYNFVYTGNLFTLWEGGEKRKRKKDHKANEIEQQNNRGILGDIKCCDYISHTFSTIKFTRFVQGQNCFNSFSPSFFR
jgi:hypothetical protein